MVNLTCQQCGSGYQAKPYIAKRSAGRFCGQPCYFVWQRSRPKGTSKRVAVPCAQCGITLSKFPSAAKPRNFCDSECRVEFMKVFMGGDNNPAWRGGHKYYRGPNWKRASKKAMQRDGFICQHCRATGDLDVHHVRPFILFDHYIVANDLSNLLTLCATCHGKADARFWKDNPDLVDETRMPYCLQWSKCELCEAIFQPNSGAAKFCDDCVHFTCLQCGVEFLNRAHVGRVRKYCSRECRHAHVKTPAGARLISEGRKRAAQA